MSRYKLLFISVFMISATAFGQIKGGLKAGVNLADIIVTDGKGQLRFVTQTL